MEYPLHLQNLLKTHRMDFFVNKIMYSITKEVWFSSFEKKVVFGLNVTKKKIVSHAKRLSLI